MAVYDLLNHIPSFSMANQMNISSEQVIVYMIILFLIFICIFVHWIAQIKSEASARIQEMVEIIDDMTRDHDEELNIERRKISAHCIKIRMQQRDCVTKVGSLQRKLREKQATVKSLSTKLISLEWAEEDANDLVDELMDAKKTITEQDELIESLRVQLTFFQSQDRQIIKSAENVVCEHPILLKLFSSDEENKENSIQDNKPVF